MLLSNRTHGRRMCFLLQDVSAMPLAKRSFLGALLPESLLYVLETYGIDAFADALVADADTPEVIWTYRMRAERLISQLLQHLVSRTPFGDYTIGAKSP